MPTSESSRRETRTASRCSLICVGSELLRGKINTHASTLARHLASIGLDLVEEHTVGDEFKLLAHVIRRALRENDLVIVTGGLGPTFDDLTREAAAAACGLRLVFSAKLLREIQAKFTRARFRAMPPANKRQAFLLEGAAPIPNRVGTAPGQWIKIMWSGKILILLPGPPTELIPMLEQSVIPRLRKTFPALPRAQAHLHFVGLPESVVDHRIRPMIAKEKGVQFTILAHLGLVDLDIFVTGRSRRQAAKRLDPIIKRARAKMGSAFYGLNGDYPLEKVVMDCFMARKASLAVAESCTGGMLAARLTDVAGSSKYFKGGVVSYSNNVKVAALGVSQKTLEKHGAVSAQTAAEMAKGIREKLASTWGLSITGIAGPGGEGPAKPVGLVYLGLSGPRSTRTYELRLRGARDAIRQRSVIEALDLLRLIYL